MLVLSASLFKSGSAWFLYLVNDMMVSAGYSDNRMIRNKFDLKFIKYDECNIQEPDFEKLRILTTSPVSNYSFVVKTHYPPNEYILKSLSEGKIKATYIYRDPRDVAVSGLEAGKRLRDRGIFERFANLKTMEQAIAWSAGILRKNWEKWAGIEGVLCFKYEDLVKNTVGELLRLANFLEIKVKEDKIKEIIKNHSSKNLKKSNVNLNKYHFNKGKTGRFREVMTEEEIELCNKTFGHYLEKMGYSKI